MKLDKASKRDKKRNKRKNGMVITGRSVFTIIQSQIKRSQKKEQKDENSK